jgi:formate hydrogenlyase subunit 3/multisubunit Na+/H+ antiporter MnhD subunit
LVPSRITDEPTPEIKSLDELIAIAFARLDAVSLGTAVGIVAGLAIFLASAILLLKGGEVVGPNLSLLGHFLIGYEVSWTGAFVGLIEAAIAGFVLGYAGAWLRNSCIDGYAYFVKRGAEAKEERELLEKI